MSMGKYTSECDEYLNILVTNIYLDIRSYQFFFYEYIRTFVRVKFVCTNIFGHSLVSVLECKTKTNIRIYSNIRAIFNTNTYSDIRSSPDVCGADVRTRFLPAHLADLC